MTIIESIHYCHVELLMLADYSFWNENPLNLCHNVSHCHIDNDTDTHDTHWMSKPTTHPHTWPTYMTCQP